VTSISINQFTNNLQEFLKPVIQQHIPLKITSQEEKDFVISAEGWDQQQETLFVLQNNNLMQQISRSMATHTENQRYRPSKEDRGISDRSASFANTLRREGITF
jgi:antitoxin YefM